MAQQFAIPGALKLICGRVLACALAAAYLAPAARTQAMPSSPQASPSETGRKAAEGRAPLPRGKKLILKDGSFQLVREYEVEGDRVRYYSLDSSQWEEMPVAMVDWDATKKMEKEEARHDAEILGKVRSREGEERAQPLDIDASLEAAPGVFLPPGMGLFAFDGKTILKLAQAKTDAKLVKKRIVEQVLAPIPIVPTRKVISIERPHAGYRVTNGQPEFYLRTTDAKEPQLELIRATVHGDRRQIENLDKLFGEEHAKVDALPIERLQLAPGVYRFEFGKPLAPGEYALAEIVHGDEIAFYVWDFGVDKTSSPPPPVQ